LTLSCIGALSPASAGLIMIIEAQARPRLSFEMLSLSFFSLSDKAAEVVAEQLKKVGIEVKVVKMDPSAIYPRIMNTMNTFNCNSFALAVSQSPDPAGMLNTFHSSYQYEVCRPIRSRPRVPGPWRP